MKTSIRIRSLHNRSEVERHIRHRTRFALGRFEHAVRAMLVVVHDLNGPRGGVDKACLVKLEHADGPPVIVRRVAMTVEEAVDLALARAARALDRSRTRVRSHGRRRRDDALGDAVI